MRRTRRRLKLDFSPWSTFRLPRPDHYEMDATVEAKPDSSVTATNRDVMRIHQPVHRCTQIGERNAIVSLGL